MPVWPLLVKLCVEPVESIHRVVAQSDLRIGHCTDAQADLRQITFAVKVGGFLDHRAVNALN
jgi:hypothetical protein